MNEQMKEQMNEQMNEQMKEQMKELEEYKVSKFTGSVLTLFFLLLPILLSHSGCFDSRIVSLIGYICIFISVFVMMIANVALAVYDFYGISVNHCIIVIINVLYYVLIYNMGCYKNPIVYLIVFILMILYHYCLNFIYPVIEMAKIYGGM